MTDSVVRVGVIGCGGIAQHAHLPSIQRTPRAKLMAVCDPYPDVAREVARVNGLQQADAYAEHAPILARQDVDAVTICAPTTQHAAITVEALRAGKHVLVEKPMAVTSDEARTMTAAAEAAGRTLMVGYNHSYDPAARHVKEMLAVGDLGEILYAEIFFYEDLYSWTAGALSRTIRAKDQKSFWPVYDNAYENLREFIHNFDSHVLNLMRLLLGEPRGLDYCHWNDAAGLWAMFDYGTFKTGFKNVRLKQHRFEKGIEICGRKKRVRLSLAPPMERYTPGRVEVIDVEKNTVCEPFLGWQWPFELEHEHFLDCVLGGKEPLTSGRQALGDVVLAETMARKAVGG